MCIRDRKDFPKENFEIRWEANRLDGSDFFVGITFPVGDEPVSYTHLRAHETVLDLVCRLLLEKKNTDRIKLNILYLHNSTQIRQYITTTNDK